MNVKRAVLAVVLGMMAAGGFGMAEGRAFAFSGTQPQDVRPIDRWLVSVPDVADGMESGERLATDLLGAPGELGVLPQRGAEAGGVTWRLVRRDGEATIPLDSMIPDGRRLGLVAYVHSYVRLPADRTLRLDLGGSDCTSARAWLNGREVSASAIDVRLGAGWNTLLVKLLAGDCPFGFHAALTAHDGAGPLDDVVVRATRPYGEVRTGPEDWIVAADTARLVADRRWRGDRLYAGLELGLTAWGRAPVSGVEVELRGIPEGRATVPWLVPGVGGDVVIPVRLDRLDELLRRGRGDLRLRWSAAEVERSVAISDPPPARSRRLALDGWEVARAGGGESDAPGARVPTAAGWVLEGEWRVPEALAGRRLVLETRDAPGDYVINGSPARIVDGETQLCSPCSRGVRLRISAASTGAWTAPPTVRIEGGEGT